jgi:hypothetical protein
MQGEKVSLVSFSLVSAALSRTKRNQIRGDTRNKLWFITWTQNIQRLCASESSRQYKSNCDEL